MRASAVIFARNFGSDMPTYIKYILAETIVTIALKKRLTRKGVSIQHHV